MRVEVIGGGPAGLWLAILLGLRAPDWKVHVHERNRKGDTFGWGVVFSDATLEELAGGDPPTLARIKAAMAYWRDIETHVHGEVRVSAGHGFCGLRRTELLRILEERATELGATVTHDDEVLNVEALSASADLVVAADGVNSAVRQRWAETFEPTVEEGACRFAWFGTSRRFDRFTFIFAEHDAGLFQVHAYPFDAETSTFIVECREEVYRRAGLDKLGEAESAAWVQRLFAPWLGGHPILTNRSTWRSFPTVRNARWSRGNVCLLGDALHTAHFSIGSGTKLAMESAMALADALVAPGTASLPARLAAWEEVRRPHVGRLQAAAATSLAWFENSARPHALDTDTFCFSLLTRSKRITWDELQMRDPAGMRRLVERWGSRPSLTPLGLRGITLGNRIVVSPMCQYSAVEGLPDDWQLVHLGSRAVGGAGLVMAEATAVVPDGRITPGCTGIYTSEQAEAWARVVRFVHTRSDAKIGLQIGHAGRKASCSVPWAGDAPLQGAEAWPVLGPSALPFNAGWPTPRAATLEDLATLEGAFVAAARRAAEAGFDVLELHCATSAPTNTGEAWKIGCASRAGSSPPCAPPGPRTGRFSFASTAAPGCLATTTMPSTCRSPRR
jgi:anthraniloyl-CoA monooxygenase